MTEHFSDILYKTSTVDKHSFLCFLFEHKSYDDRWTAFQLLKYMVKIWEQFLKQNKNATELPVITPVVIYHGKKSWNNEYSLRSLFKDSESTLDYIPDFRFEVYDLTTIPEKDIKGVLPLKVLLLLQKYIFDPKLLERFPIIVDQLKEILEKSGDKDYLESVLWYLTSVVDVDTMEKMSTIVVDKLKDGGEQMTTWAEKWIQVGIEKGIEKGKIEAAEKMILKGMSNADIQEITGLSIEVIEELRKKLGTPNNS